MNTKMSFNTSASWKTISKNKNVRDYSYLAFSIIAALILLVLAVKPTLKKIVTLQNTIGHNRQILKQLQDKSNQLDQAVANFNAIPETTKLKFYTLLPDTPNLTCYIDSLKSSAPQSIKFQGIQVQPYSLEGSSNCTPQTSDLSSFEENTVTKTTLTEIPYTMSVSGSYDDLVTFIDTLNHNSRLTSIQTVVFNKPEKSSLVVTISGKIFFYK